MNSITPTDLTVQNSVKINGDSRRTSSKSQWGWCRSKEANTGAVRLASTQMANLSLGKLREADLRERSQTGINARVETGRGKKKKNQESCQQQDADYFWATCASIRVCCTAASVSRQQGSHGDRAFLEEVMLRLNEVIMGCLFCWGCRLATLVQPRIRMHTRCPQAL